MRILTAAVATLLGIGRAPFAPGTVASLAALPLAWGITQSGGRVLLIVCTLAATALGIWASDRYARACGTQDPSECVVDELAGQWLACAVAPLSLLGYAVAFLAFRAFDIWKPWPISAAERQPGGVGIMLDDIVAGAAAGVVVAGVRAAGLI